MPSKSTKKRTNYDRATNPNKYLPNRFVPVWATSFKTWEAYGLTKAQFQALCLTQEQRSALRSYAVEVATGKNHGTPEAPGNGAAIAAELGLTLVTLV